MRFLIVGAGAVGAYIGACLARAGSDVTLHARGAHLAAMQKNGVRVITAKDEFTVHPEITGNLADAGTFDVVFLGVKAHGLPALAPQLKPVIGPATTVVSTQNGIPWWYFQRERGPLAGTHIERIDPGGVISAVIAPEHVVGSLIYFASEIVRPGVIQHNEGNRVTLGEPDGTRSERCRQISEALIAAGLRSPVTTQIRTEIWVKLMGNIAFNPISALTGATLAHMIRTPEIADVVRGIMGEVEAVTRKLGIELPVTIEQRIAGAAKIGEHKTSMLQDLEAGRPLELEAIVGAVLELNERLGVEMPHTRAIYACTKLMAECRTAALAEKVHA
jgi:2-dehydropantoate 2-reductase